MDEQNVLYAYHGISFSLKKERDSDIHYNMMNLADITPSEIGQTQKNIV